jgi:phenylacetate-CoA ligase
VRYQILDRGGLIEFSRMIEFLRDGGFDPLAGNARNAPVRDLPFVYVFGRSGFAVSFYGANVYPENVSVGLEQPEIASKVTGKFVMQVGHDDSENAELLVFVELAANGVDSPELALVVARSIRSQLERLNSEFLNYAPAERRTPKVRLLPLGHPDYFPVGVKHRYTR